MLLKTNVEKPPTDSWQILDGLLLLFFIMLLRQGAVIFAMNIITTDYIVQSTSQNRYPQNNVSLPNRSISTKLNPNLVKLDSSSIETQETTKAGVNLGGADHE